MLFPSLIKKFYLLRDPLFLVLILAVVMSTFVRFRPVVEGTFPYLYDHGRDYLDVMRIVEDKNLTFIGPTTGVVGIYHGPLHYYLLAIGYIFSGGHPASGVALTALAHIVAGIACFVLGTKFFDKRFGVLLAAIFLLSLSSLRSSNSFWNPNWIPPLMVFFYFSLLAAFRVNKKYWLLVGFISGLIAQFEIAFGVFLLPFLLVVALLSDKKILISGYFWSSFIMFGIPFLPLVAFDIKNGFMMVKGALSVVNGTYSALGETIPLMLRFRYRFNEVWRASFESFSPTIALNYALLVLCTGFLLYILYKRKKQELYYSMIFLLLPLIMYVGFMFYDKPAWSYYWIGIQVSFYFLAAYALYIVSHISTFFKFTVGALILSFFASAIYPSFQSADFIAHEPGIYINQLRVIDTIYADANSEPFSVMVYTPPIYDYTYQYLFHWRGKKHGFTPQNSRNAVYYLILEENKDRPYEVQGFRATHAKESQAVWSRKYPGNLTVEKYEIN